MQVLEDRRLLEEAWSDDYGRIKLYGSQGSSTVFVVKSPNTLGITPIDAEIMDTIIGQISPNQVLTVSAHSASFNTHSPNTTLFTDLTQNPGASVYYQYTTSSISHHIQNYSTLGDFTRENDTIYVLGYLKEVGMWMQANLNWHACISPASILMSGSGIRLVHPAICDRFVSDLRTTARDIASCQDWHTNLFADKTARLDIAKSNVVMAKICSDHELRISKQVDCSLATVLCVASGKTDIRDYIDCDGSVLKMAVRSDLQMLKRSCDPDLLWLLDQVLLNDGIKSFDIIEKMIAMKPRLSSKISESLRTSPLSTGHHFSPRPTHTSAMEQSFNYDMDRSSIDHSRLTLTDHTQSNLVIADRLTMPQNKFKGVRRLGLKSHDNRERMTNVPNWFSLSFGATEEITSQSKPAYIRASVSETQPTFIPQKISLRMPSSESRKQSNSQQRRPAIEETIEEFNQETKKISKVTWLDKNIVNNGQKYFNSENKPRSILKSSPASPKPQTPFQNLQSPLPIPNPIPNPNSQRLSTPTPATVGRPYIIDRHGSRQYVDRPPSSHQLRQSITYHSRLPVKAYQTADHRSSIAHRPLPTSSHYIANGYSTAAPNGRHVRYAESSTSVPGLACRQELAYGEIVDRSPIVLGEKFSCLLNQPIKIRSKNPIVHRQNLFQVISDTTNHGYFVSNPRRSKF